MSVLQRKLGRELTGNAGTLASVIAIIAIGTGCYIGMGSAVRILSVSQQQYYREYRFADFWVRVKKAPLTAVRRVASLEGVSVVEARVVQDVIIDVPGVIQPLSGRLTSVPARGYDQVLNGIHLVRGGGFSDDRDEEVILSEAFANAHGLEPGDDLELILNRKRQSFRIVGTAISPEYVYMVRGEGDIVPDPKRFGTLYIKEDFARDVLDFQAACNELVGQLVAGDEVHIDALLDRIERELEPYGVLSTTPRKRHASHRFLQDEIDGGRISSTITPAIFLTVAALVLNVLMSRFAQRQRSIIGTLKALGYSDQQVLLHFVSFGVVVGLIGGALGNGVGIALAAGMVEMYRGFYQFPSFVYELYPDLLIFGVLISVGFATAGTLKGVWTVLRLRPAESMRPKPPERGGAIFLERWPRVWTRLGFRTQIALRNLMRNRLRTLTGMTATMLAASMILLSLMMYDSLWYLVDFQYARMLHSDADIGMRDERSVTALYEARRLPGVDYAEPLLGLTCDVRHGRFARRLSITGLSAEHRLTTPLGRDLKPIEIPREGVVLARKLAELLDARLGDHLEITPVRGRRETARVPVAAVVDTFLGLDCYADQRYLSGVVGEAWAMNGIQVLISPGQRTEFFHAVKKTPNAQGLNVRSESQANIEDTLIQTMTAMIGILIGFAGMIAFGAILNNSLVEISDQRREISTFRVLGYQPRQLAAIYFRQSMITSVIGVVLAVPVGYGLVVLLLQAYDTELFRLPVVLKMPTILTSTLSALFFVLASQAIVYQQIRRLDWLAGIQVHE